MDELSEHVSLCSACGVESTLLDPVLVEVPFGDGTCEALKGTCSSCGAPMLIMLPASDIAS